MSNPILSEHPRQTAPDGLQAAPALEPTQLPPDVLETIQECCRVLLTAGHESLMKRLWNIGSAIEERQQQQEEIPS